MTYWCWVEVRPFDPIRQERIEVRACSADHRNATGRGGMAWEPAIVQAPEASMRLWNGDFTNAVAPGGARIPLQMGVLADGESLAKRCFWTGAPVILWAAESDSGALPAEPFFVGRVTSSQRQGDVLTLECGVDEEPFAKDVLTATYAGTTGAEGPTDLKGRVKPLVIGHAKNVEPVLIDATNNVYQFSGYGAIEEVTALYERASLFGSPTGNYASYANLVAASIPNGRWASCLNQGMIRLGAPAYGLITGDIKGHKVGSATPRLTGAVIEALAGIAGVDSELILGATLDAMDAVAPYPINLVLRDQAEWFDIARQLALMVNHQAGISLTGQFFALAIGFEGQSQLLLDAQGGADPQVIKADEERVSPPFYKTIVGANRNWRVQAADEIAFYATLNDRGQYSAGTTYREGDIVSLPNGAKYLYINTSPSSGNDPPNGTYWAQIGGAVGEVTNIVYRRAAAKPSTPGASSGVPAGWVDQISSVGAGTDPIWGSFGIKAAGSTTYTWQSPFAIADDGRLWSGLDSGGNVQPGKVDTPAVVDDAISDTPYAYNGSNKSLSTSMTLVLDITLPSSVAGKEQILSGLIDCSAPTFEGSELSLKMTVERCTTGGSVQSTIVNDRKFANFNDEGSASGVMSNFAFRDTPDATNRRYRVYVAVTDSSTITATTDSFIASEALKK